MYKGTLARNPRCSRRGRIYEAGIITPVEVDQCADNCLREAERLLTAIRSKCRPSCADITFHRPLPVFRVVRCSSVPNLQHCRTVPLHTSSYCAMEKSSFSKADNFIPFKLQLKISLLRDDSVPYTTAATLKSFDDYAFLCNPKIVESWA
ncbi:uncharacterized protein TNCV_2329331 [Trichonephila clavipes]|nr:uncharacterized protein TNCV_2329331 [Trichonephila clavipes]